MGESVVVRQNRQYETAILALDPHDPNAKELVPVEHVFGLTPYGMMLAGLGACTAIVLNSYAEHHGVGLQQVELRLTYDRVFQEDCEDCESTENYAERIEMELSLAGELTPELRKKLLAIARQCPIHKMLADGIEVESRLAESDGAEEQA